MTLQGSCLCRTVAYEADSLGGPIVHCHCATCRKAHAAAYASTVRVERPHFRIVRGQDKLTAHESSPGKFRHFCSVCGSHVVAERPAQTHIILRVATLDDDPGLTPEMHIWTSHDAPWLNAAHDIPAFPEMPT